MGDVWDHIMYMCVCVIVCIYETEKETITILPTVDFFPQVRLMGDGGSLIILETFCPCVNLSIAMEFHTHA